MKKALIIGLLAISIGGSCKKEKAIEVKGTVLHVLNEIAMVAIENPHPAKHSFICAPDDSMPVEMENSCTKNVFILNLPENLLTVDKKIRFSKFDDKGPRPIWSVHMAAHDLMVYDASAR